MCGCHRVGIPPGLILSQECAMADIKIESLRHIYSEGTPFEKTALEDITLELPQGQLIGLIGHTGSGKSTLIQHLNALFRPTSGTVFLDGKDINADKVSRRDVKFRVGLVFQYPEYQLFEETVYKDIAYGPGNMGLSASEIDERVREAAGFADVDESLFDRSPLELSGGQKRRIAIAGVIAMRPGVLVLDEPTSGLDPEASRNILENIRNYREKTGSTVIIVSHNMDDMARIAERIIVLSKGTVVMDGTPAEVFSDAEKLRGYGLSVPKATEIAGELRKRGVRIDEAVFTHEMLLSALLKVKEAEKC